MRAVVLALMFAVVSAAEPVQQMVEGITQYLLRATGESAAHRSPSHEKLRKMLGVVDQRVLFADLELIADTSHPALVYENGAFQVFAVRWPVLEGVTAEGLWFKPRGRVAARAVAIPDADGLPEQFRASQAMAAAGCEVLSPVLINRQDTWSGLPRFKMTNQPHREFIYRMAFEVGRQTAGYEVQKVLAAVDWFAARQPSLPIGVWGYGEGGGIALFAGALDERITSTGVSGYFSPREGLWKQPIDHNLFGFLKDFGDAELAGMIAPRALIVDTTAGPVWNGPAKPTAQRSGAAAGVLIAASGAEVAREVDRARALYKGSKLAVTDDGLTPFLNSIGGERKEAPSVDLPQRDADGRQHRQFEELVDYNQKLARLSHFLREDGKIAERRERLWNDVIGKLPAATMPMNVKQTKAYENGSYLGYDVTYDVFPDVFGYGVLLVPKDLKDGERRPVVVAQHGLEGHPQDLFNQPESSRMAQVYANIGDKLIARGYVVYLPQNPYTGDFRKIQRLANPLGLSLFSFIIAQHDRLLDWLSTLPYVDAKRIGFYGLSYGGKTAMRVPAMLDRYAFSICAGDFNEWVHKVTTVDDAQTYMTTQEIDMLEFDLASVANYAEMAMMIAPRPFMVERGHRDGVGLDEWVAFEFAKVRRYYDQQGIGDRTAIEFFDGPHQIHAVGTMEFIKKWFGR